MHFLEPLLTRSDRPHGLYIEGRQTAVAAVVETAFDSTARKRGLLGRHSLPAGSALVIAPSSAIHTFGMRFPIDVIFARRDGRVIKLRRSLPAARLAVALRAFAVIEMAPGAIEGAGLAVGDRLIVRPLDVNPAPPHAG